MIIMKIYDNIYDWKNMITKKFLKSLKIGNGFFKKRNLTTKKRRFHDCYRNFSSWKWFNSWQSFMQYGVWFKHWKSESSSMILFRQCRGVIHKRVLFRTYNEVYKTTRLDKTCHKSIPENFQQITD